MIDPIPLLGRRIATPAVLRTYRRRGPAAAIEALQLVGGAGHEGDHHVQFHISNGNRRIELIVDGERSPHLTRDVLDWAAGRLDDTDWAQLDALDAARTAGFALAYPTDEDHHKEIFRPAELTTEERNRIGAGRRQAHDAELAAHDLIRARLHTSNARPGDQLDLFATP